jgi:hypothetical protein
MRAVSGSPTRTASLAVRSGSPCCSRGLVPGDVLVRHLEDAEIRREPADLLVHVREVALTTGPTRDEHDVGALTPRQMPCRLTKQPLRAVPGDRVAHPAGGDDGDPGGSGGSFGGDVDDGQVAGPLTSSAEDRGDGAAVGQPIECDRSHRVRPRAWLGHDGAAR